MLNFGLGGPAGLKGSDAMDLSEALAEGGQPRGKKRCMRLLAALGATLNNGINLLVFVGAMEPHATCAMPWVTVFRR